MGNRRFTCDMCDKKFTRAAFLNGHKRSHHNSVKLKCNTCQATFCFMHSLRKHKGQCGRDVGERADFDCSLCDASFTTKRAAMLQERSTHGEQRHVCENCGFRRRFLKVFFYHIWAWQPSRPCDTDATDKLSLPLPKEAPHKIWL